GFRLSHRSSTLPHQEKLPKARKLRQRRGMVVERLPQSCSSIAAVLKIPRSAGRSSGQRPLSQQPQTPAGSTSMPSVLVRLRGLSCLVLAGLLLLMLAGPVSAAGPNSPLSRGATMEVFGQKIKGPGELAAIILGVIVIIVLVIVTIIR